MTSETSSTPKKLGLRLYTIVSVVLSIAGFITPLTFLMLFGILLAGFIVYRSHRSKGGWFALVFGIVLFVVIQWIVRLPS